MFFVGVQLDMEVAAPTEVAAAERTAASHRGMEHGGAGAPADEITAAVDAAPAPLQRLDAGAFPPRAGLDSTVGQRDSRSSPVSPAAAAQEAAEHFSALSGGKLRTASAPAVADRRSVDSLLPQGQAPRRPPVDRSKAFEAFTGRHSFGDASGDGSGALPTISESGSLSHSISSMALLHKGTVGAGGSPSAVWNDCAVMLVLLSTSSECPNVCCLQCCRPFMCLTAP